MATPPSRRSVLFTAGAVLSAYHLQSNGVVSAFEQGAVEDPVSVLNSLDRQIFPPTDQEDQSAPLSEDAGADGDSSQRVSEEPVLALTGTANAKSGSSHNQVIAFLEEKKNGFRLQCPPGQPCNCNCHCNKAASAPPAAGAAAAAAAAPPAPPPPPPVVV
ncbi:unnamed protein product [Amoebophrya sp. A120]|nr:unnamed protein product [Amoebophrya sp. A120]|eukprot:GSA120T00007836001.1